MSEETKPSIDDNKILVNVKPNDHATHDDPTSKSLSPIENSLFRKIDFHLAKKPSAAFANETGDSSFQLEFLNPTSTNLNVNDDHDDLHGAVVHGFSNGVTDKPSVMKRKASELSPDNDFDIDLRRIGAGLENLGNTCFLNSVLQCLTYTEPLVAYLQSGKHQISCRNAGFCTLCAIQKHVSCALKSSGKSLVPLEFVLNLKHISRSFQIFRQEDAHEYMVNLFESMHKCCLPSEVATGSPSAYENSLVHKIFGGNLRSQVKCMQCNYSSNKFEPFIDLSLEILKVNTIYKALEDFTAEEQLDGYDCQDCKEKVKALKQFTIHEAPNVLTIHLKRFCSFMSSLKINKKVHFGPTLNLKPFVSGPYDRDLEYTLYGVLVHSGLSTHSGHYYCFVRTSSSTWFLLNDDQVIQVSEESVMKQKAYILFYCHERNNHPSKKPAGIIRLKERVMNTMGRNNTCPIEKMGNTNGTTETSAQNDSSESCVETLQVLVQKDMVNVPPVLNAPTVVNISDQKGQDIEDTVKVENTMNEPTISSISDEKGQNIEDTMKFDNTMNEPTISSISDEKGQDIEDTMKVDNNMNEPTIYSISDEKGQDIEDTMKVGSTVNEQTIHNIPDEKGQDIDNAIKVDSTMNEPTISNMSDEKGNAATVPSIFDGPEKHSPMNDKKEALSTILMEHEEKCTCEDLSDSIAVKISNKPEIMAIIESACGFSWEINPGGLIDADGGGGGESQKAVDISTESLRMQIIETSLIDTNVYDQESRKKTKNHLKVKATSIMHMGRMLNSRKKKKHKRQKRSNFPTKNLDLEGNISGSNIEDRTDNLLSNNIESEFKERIHEGDAMLGSFVDRHSNGDMGSSPLETTELGSSENFTRLQCKDQSICPMQVFEDRTVPLWHENGSTSSQIRETQDIPSIGFIGDEWDDEQGKRKKARAGSCTQFDRRNGFQDLADERQNCHAGKRKKPRKKRSKKFHKSRSGNKSFRR